MQLFFFASLSLSLSLSLSFSRFVLLPGFGSMFSETFAFCAPITRAGHDYETPLAAAEGAGPTGHRPNRSSERTGARARIMGPRFGCALSLARAHAGCCVVIVITSGRSRNAQTTMKQWSGVWADSFAALLLLRLLQVLRFVGNSNHILTRQRNRRMSRRLRQRVQGVRALRVL